MLRLALLLLLSPVRAAGVTGVPDAVTIVEEKLNSGNTGPVAVVGPGAMSQFVLLEIEQGRLKPLMAGWGVAKIRLETGGKLLVGFELDTSAGGIWLSALYDYGNNFISRASSPVSQAGADRLIAYHLSREYGRAKLVSMEGPGMEFVLAHAGELTSATESLLLAAGYGVDLSAPSHLYFAPLTADRQEALIERRRAAPNYSSDKSTFDDRLRVYRKSLGALRVLARDGRFRIVSGNYQGGPHGVVKDEDYERAYGGREVLVYAVSQSTMIDGVYVDRSLGEAVLFVQKDLDLSYDEDTGAWSAK